MSFPRLQNLLTVPNLLSLSRIPLGVAFWFALGASAALVSGAFAILALAALTDVLDGYLARRLAARAVGGTGGAVEPGGGVGAWLDPICDKLFVASVLAAILVRRQPPIWVLMLIVSRELVQLPIGVVYRFLPALRSWLRYDFRASVLGKGATVAQFIAIAALILGHPWIRLFAFLSFVLGIAALVDYFRRALAIGKRRLETAKASGTAARNP
ncbi:MAG TPA: CDP-alcohol phosphatidyltransferase family protein [Polyangia bacterium]|jgi:phosphatidylglycerophosphate synthase|nr:CDP-alcohol phosphatidyltransferase family protein [Polyangia bacterium]